MSELRNRVRVFSTIVCLLFVVGCLPSPTDDTSGADSSGTADSLSQDQTTDLSQPDSLTEGDQKPPGDTGVNDVSRMATNCRPESDPNKTIQIHGQVLGFEMAAPSQVIDKDVWVVLARSADLLTQKCRKGFEVLKDKEIILRTILAAVEAGSAVDNELTPCALIAAKPLLSNQFAFTTTYPNGAQLAVMLVDSHKIGKKHFANTINLVSGNVPDQICDYNKAVALAMHPIVTTDIEAVYGPLDPDEESNGVTLGIVINSDLKPQTAIPVKVQQQSLIDGNMTLLFRPLLQNNKPELGPEGNATTSATLLFGRNNNQGAPGQDYFVQHEQGQTLSGLTYGGSAYGAIVVTYFVVD